MSVPILKDTLSVGTLPAAKQLSTTKVRGPRCRKVAAAVCAALTVLSPTLCDSQGLECPPVATAAAIWVHPLPAADAWPGGSPSNGGSTDLLSLFQADAPWRRVAAKTQVFGLYAGWIAEISPQVLQSAVAFLNAHNMAIEIEAPSLQATATCGSGVEGYVPYGQTVHDFTLAYLQPLKAAGAQQIFIKVDEPFYFGSIVGDPRSCHFSPQQVAAEVGQYVQLVKTVYPGAAVGDVEPIVAGPYSPDVVTAMAQWHETYQMVTGQPFPFFFADIDFSNPEWPAIVKQIENQTRQSGMRFGIIYIGDLQDTSDAEWASQVGQRSHLYQGVTGGRPDYVLFQSWEPHPSRALPESNPISFTGVVKAYLDAMQPLNNDQNGGH
jgi:hypothetical protein